MKSLTPFFLSTCLLRCPSETFNNTSSNVLCHQFGEFTKPIRKSFGKKIPQVFSSFFSENSQNAPSDRDKGIMCPTPLQYSLKLRNVFSLSLPSIAISYV
ncbi:hypothetical protein L873DRAFT_1189923 [Choiromyces venosus 120613-1]|uniref:Uncharacterized protein n=1 Tax=Choiromyces venosus 120613-1 TaxID=1336337 RepID=A0A3N4JSZ0_9PEZI|nr:hypothetical protein L873DRAFT_1189923 [Choiromyces venosus 120613-1]